ncbi:hypothetical protein D920_00945 [Enterococcus faecalis 13-SD-W-01]|nr:hypothetical protein D920_00945 [Enterococcus faecalis 13-SD-W-01]
MLSQNLFFYQEILFWKYMKLLYLISRCLFEKYLKIFTDFTASKLTFSLISRIMKIKI